MSVFIHQDIFNSQFNLTIERYLKMFKDKDDRPLSHFDLPLVFRSQDLLIHVNSVFNKMYRKHACTTDI